MGQCSSSLSALTCFAVWIACPSDCHHCFPSGHSRSAVFTGSDRFRRVVDLTFTVIVGTQSAVVADILPRVPDKLLPESHSGSRRQHSGAPARADQDEKDRLIVPIGKSRLGSRWAFSWSVVARRSQSQPVSSNFKAAKRWVSVESGSRGVSVESSIV